MIELRGLSAILYEPEEFEIEGRRYKFLRIPLGALWRMFRVYLDIYRPVHGMNSPLALFSGIIHGMVKHQAEFEKALVSKMRQWDGHKWVKVSIGDFRDEDRFPLGSLPFLIEQLLYHPDVTSFFGPLARIWNHPMILARRSSPRMTTGKTQSEKFDPTTLPGLVVKTSSTGSRLLSSPEWSQQLEKPAFVQRKRRGSEP